MKRLLAPAIILLIVFIFFWQFFLKGLIPIPSDALVGLYHPFRDLYAQQYPRGIPFKNFLITDPIRQQYPWRELAISLEKKFQLPLWNPYSFSGYPLLANFQSAVFYPLNILFVLLPFSLSWGFLIFLQPLLGGLFLYFYLQNLKLGKLASITGSICFAFSGFSIAWMEWNSVIQTIAWLPLILLSADKVLFDLQTKRNHLIWGSVFIFSICASFLAGHLQMFFYELLIVLIYILTKISQSKEKKKSLILFTIYFLLFTILTSIQWLPTLQFIFLSARSLDQSYMQAGWFLPYQNLIQFIAPDFFGNPTTLNYWGIWNYAEFVGYIGVLPFVFVLFALFTRHDKKTYFWGIICLTAFLFTLPTPLAQIPYTLHIPFISTSQPTRLIGVVDFALAILSALGLDFFFKSKSIKIFWVLGIIGIFFGILWIVVLKLYPYFGVILDNILVSKQNLIFPTLIFFISLAIIVTIVFYKNKNFLLLLQFAILIIILFDLFRFGWKFLPFTPKSYLYPSPKSLQFLQQNIGYYRFMTTDSRILAPNISNVYRLQSIEGYDPLYLQNYGEFIAAMQRNKADISSPFGFNRIITPHEFKSPLINLLGVRYILTFDDMNSKGYRKVFQEGLTKIYENTSVFPRAFFIKQIISSINKQDSINKVFDNVNNLYSTAIVQSLNSQDLSLGFAQITNYQPNIITILTKNNGLGFLVLTDVFYSTWRAFIDGKEVRIYPIDYAFRGIFVPAGQHRIEFKDQLF